MKSTIKETLHLKNLCYKTRLSFFLFVSLDLKRFVVCIHYYIFKIEKAILYYGVDISEIFVKC